MEFITDLKKYKIEGETVCAIGKFVGIHLGHQKLIRTMISEKEKLAEKLESSKTKADVKTVLFVIKGITETILKDEERKDKLEKLGIDVIVECDFNDELRTMSAERFLDRILLGRLGAKVLVAGPDLRFGYEGKGDANFLREMEKEKDFKLIIIDKEKYKEEIISSTRIKACIAAGEIEEAEAMLGQ